MKPQTERRLPTNCYDCGAELEHVRSGWGGTGTAYNCEGCEEKTEADPEHVVALICWTCAVDHDECRDCREAAESERDCPELSELHAMATRNDAQAVDIAALRQDVDAAQRASLLALDELDSIMSDAAALLEAVPR